MKQVIAVVTLIAVLAGSIHATGTVGPCSPGTGSNCDSGDCADETIQGGKEAVAGTTTKASLTASSGGSSTTKLKWFANEENGKFELDHGGCHVIMQPKRHCLGEACGAALISKSPAVQFRLIRHNIMEVQRTHDEVH